MAVLSLLRKCAEDSVRWEIPAEIPAEKSCLLSFLNAHCINNAVKQPEFSKTLHDSDYLLRDGVGIELAFKVFSLPKTPNLNGTDLIPDILSRHPDASIAIYGTSDAALAACKERLAREGINNVVSTLNGFLPVGDYKKDFQQHKPNITLLCMGMPRQEMLAAELHKLNQPGLIICAGGWADFHSGTKPRAPLWVRKLKGEWLYRLAHEPKRLGKRYTIDVLYYFYVLLRAKFTKGSA